jgi:hypothetical protein
MSNLRIRTCPRRGINIGSLYHHKKGQWTDSNQQGNPIPVATYNISEELILEDVPNIDALKVNDLGWRIS